MNSYKKVVDAAIRASINPDSMRSQYSPDNKYKLGTPYICFEWIVRACHF